MPFTRRIIRRRKSYPRKRLPYKKRSMYRSKAFRNAVTAIAAANSGPIIHHDHSSAVYPDTSGAVAVLTNVAEGVTEHTRRGEETRLLSLRGIGYLLQHASATMTVVRHVIFRSMRDEQGTVPAVTDLLESAHVNSQFKQDMKCHYIILSDKTYVLTSNGRQGGPVRIYINLKNVKARYDATTANDYTKGHVYHFYISTEATNTPSLNIKWRSYFRSV